MESVSNQLGDRIRQFRKKMRLTQETLALNSGINVSFLGDVERGLKKPSIDSLEKLLKALGITFQEFFDFETSVKPFNDCTTLEKLNLELQNCSENEIEMIYKIIQQILAFNDNK